MKELSIFVRVENLHEVTEILKKHNVGGLAFYETLGVAQKSNK